MVAGTDLQNCIGEVLEQSFEARRTVVDGLEVQATVLRKDGKVHFKLTSLLRSRGVTLLLPLSSPVRCSA